MSLPLNAGAVALHDAGKVAQVARRLGVSERTIAGWRSGARVPNEASRHQLERELQIPRADWDRPVAAQGHAPPAAHTEAPPRAAGADESDWRLAVQLDRLAAMRADPDISERGRLELEKLELQVTRAVARRDGLEDLTTARFIGSRPFRELMDRATAALEPWPDAMRALAAALEAPNA